MKTLQYLEDEGDDLDDHDAGLELDLEDENDKRSNDNVLKQRQGSTAEVIDED